MIKFTNLNGISSHTKITNAETGENLGKVLAISYGAKIEIGREIVTAECELSMMRFELVAGKTEFRTLNPASQRHEAVRAIEFRDGTPVKIAEDGTPSVVAPGGPAVPAADVDEIDVPTMCGAIEPALRDKGLVLITAEEDAGCAKSGHEQRTRNLCEFASALILRLSGQPGCGWPAAKIR